LIPVSTDAAGGTIFLDGECTDGYDIRRDFSVRLQDAVDLDRCGDLSLG
jgi:hypothetical protein